MTTDLNRNLSHLRNDALSKAKNLKTVLDTASSGDAAGSDGGGGGAAGGATTDSGTTGALTSGVTKVYKSRLQHLAP